MARDCFFVAPINRRQKNKNLLSGRHALNVTLIRRLAKRNDIYSSTGLNFSPVVCGNPILFYLRYFNVRTIFCQPC
ncbi:MAG: hypothetical protein CO140_02275 [Candidatus Moranbacteria bacterium CG_4_9_14_3_um_filter_40_7]|nr:MAG: hypothetical protein COX31_03895 [Candidatus Moranbacteria bacterium CG23_combo_of_CG06-09_8_20_14_all_40_16]PIU80754.1 MAG: hypothetical protein COS71_01720 [Candidatus Moranbacteria bacterium CG06_land_8_20_14_3_00_40_12]PJA87805.1 MAG: hypothetical protein CO140_02275 [Candidatus Moranbacteria bacterium CG_4_9_14_3_um_filter_40_7]